jgi:hypothetical protein
MSGSGENMTKQEIANELALEYMFWIDKRILTYKETGSFSTGFEAEFNVISRIRKRLEIGGTKWERGLDNAHII